MQKSVDFSTQMSLKCKLHFGLISHQLFHYDLNFIILKSFSDRYAIPVVLY